MKNVIGFVYLGEYGRGARSRNESAVIKVTRVEIVEGYVSDAELDSRTYFLRVYPTENCFIAFNGDLFQPFAAECAEYIEVLPQQHVRVKAEEN